MTGEDMEFLYNDIQHQKRNTECGIYSIHFITSMLEGKDFDDYIKKLNEMIIWKNTEIFIILDNLFFLYL